jgi:gliding motility-associated-like protein
MINRIGYSWVWILCVCTSSLYAQPNFQRTYRTVQDRPEWSALAELPNGNIVMGGQLFFQQLNSFLTCVRPDGSVFWNRGIKVGASDIVKMPPRAILPLANGNVMVLYLDLSTLLIPPSQIYQQCVIAEVSGTNGNIIWSRLIGSSQDPVAYFDAVAVNDGFILGGSAGKFLSIAKVNLTGDLVWQTNHSGSDPSDNYFFSDIEKDAEGNIYGIATPLGANNYRIVAKYDPTGAVIWAGEYKGTQATYLNGSISLTPNGTPVVWTGTADLGPVNYQPILLTLDPEDGSILTDRRIVAPSKSYTANQILPWSGDQVILTMIHGSGDALGHYLKYDVNSGLVSSFYDDKVTNGAGSAINTLTNPNGILYSICERITLTPLERVTFLTRSDMMIVEEADCCHKDFPIIFQEASFEVTNLTLVPRADVWPVREFVPIYDNINMLVGNLCTQPDLVQFEVDTTPYCTGSCIQVNQTGTLTGDIAWSVVGQATIVSDTGAVFCFDQAGQYTIIARSVTDSCQRTTRTIRVEDRPLPVLVPITSLSCPGECLDIALDTLLSGQEYSWTFTGGTPATFVGNAPPPICYNTAGAFEVAVEYNGCKGRTAQNIQVGYRPFIIPNAFTPDQENNRLFRPILFCPVTDIRFSIYNRWGQQIYSTTEATTGWDGRVSGEPAPVDVYIWQLELTENREGSPTRVRQRGNVTLLR